MNNKPDWDTLYDLLVLAKGEDRSFRKYAEDAGVQHNVFNRIKRKEFCPGFLMLGKILSKEAAPRNGVGIRDFMNACGLKLNDLIEESELLNHLVYDALHKDDRESEGNDVDVDL